MTAVTATLPVGAPRANAGVCCWHCGLPVPRGLVAAGASRQFCCAGCETAWGVINGCGLDRYYRLRAEMETSPAPARGQGRAYEEYDDPVFHRLYVGRRPDGLLETELYLEGVHCAACVWLVEKLPAVLGGVVESRLDFGRRVVRIAWSEAGPALSRIARTLDTLGYPPHPAKDVNARSVRRAEERRMLVRIGVAGAAAGNAMLLAFALYGGVFGGMEPEFRALFRATSLLIAIIALAWPGSVFFRGAWASLRTRTPHLDLPIAIGLAAGGLWGAINTLRGAGDVYFESVTALVFLLLVGRWIQHRQQRSAADAVELLFSLTPSTARVVDAGGATRLAPVEALRVGETVEVHAGESAPVDGVVLDHEATVDQGLLTGESRPVRTAPGEPVHAGAVNVGGPLRMRVEATGDQTRVARLMRLVADAAARRAPIVRMADRLAGWFVGASLALAAGTAALWLWLDPSRALDNAAALLIVACPCALGLATPLAVSTALGRAARRGLLIKGGDALERLAKPGVMFLDKTGTITEGRLELVEWRGDRRAMSAVAALESSCAHPIARALTRAIGPGDGVCVGWSRQRLGAGVEGTVDGAGVLVGSPDWVGSHATTPQWAAGAVHAFTARSLTPILVAIDGEVVAVAGLGDPIRTDASASIEALRARGWSIRILSGDHPDVVASVARELGVSAESAMGGVTPERKLDAVRAAARGGRAVVMVGDGVNDAAALSAASVGVGVHAGAEASLAAADVYLNTPGLGPLVELVDGARRTVRTIHVCLGASALYNLVAASLALAGLINPIIAAVLMPLSSFTVLAIARRARTFGAQPCR